MNLLVSTILITLSWTFIQCDLQRDKLFFLQKSSELNNETLLVVTWKESKSEFSAGCEIFTDEELIREVVLSSDDSPIRTLSENEMQNLLGDCKEFTLRRRRRDSEDRMATKSSVEYTDHYSKELRENDSRQRSPQNKNSDYETERQIDKCQNGDDQSSPQNVASQNGYKRISSPIVGYRNSNGRREPQNNRNQDSASQRTPQNVTSRNGYGRRSSQDIRKQNGDSYKTPQNISDYKNVRTENGDNQMRQICNMSTTWSPNSIETAPMTSRKADFRNKTTTEISMSEATSTSTEMTTETPTTVQGYNGINIIFPGTKWCGAGDRAKSYIDLGSAEDTDKCCRAHDVCNDTLAPGETRHNLTNTSSFTKLSCECDEEFYECLDKVDSMISNTVGNVYFNVLRRECYRKDHPQTKMCKKYRTFLKLKCEEYETDTNASPVYEWVPAQRYRKIPIGPFTISLK